MNALFRIAPTPSGYLHEGNLFNFLFNVLWARIAGGKILLRIDDMDSERMRPEYVEDIFSRLDDLGIEWQLGPEGPTDFYKNWSQKTRMDLYSDLLKDLEKKKVLFGCTCSRSELFQHNHGMAYSGKCAFAGHDLNQEGIAWRLKVPGETEIIVRDIAGDIPVGLGTIMGSFVVRKKDGNPAYQLCSVADDLHFGVTHVARGADLLSSTAAQLYLAEILRTDGFGKIHWYHHPLKVSSQGDKISKSTQISGGPLQMTKDEVFTEFQKFVGAEPVRVSDITELDEHLRPIFPFAAFHR